MWGVDKVYDKTIHGVLIDPLCHLKYDLYIEYFFKDLLLHVNLNVGRNTPDTVWHMHKQSSVPRDKPFR